MTVKVKWSRTNKGDVVKLYRGASVLTDQNPGTLLTTVDGEITDYTDLSALFGERYFYRVVNESRGEVVASQSRSVLATVDTGPGPKELIWGNSFMGYFGTVPEGDIGIPINNFLNQKVLTAESYYKIIRKGRIMYVSFRTGMLSPTSLIAAGLFNSGAKSFNGTGQVTGTITVNGRKYDPRVAKYFDDENAVTDATNYTIDATKGAPFGRSEFLDLYRLFFTNITGQVATPFALNLQTGYISGSAPAFTCDFGSAGRTNVWGFTSQPQIPTAGMGITNNVGVATTNGVAFVVIEYKGI